MIQRRGFLAGLLALGAMPAIVTSTGFRSSILRAPGNCLVPGDVISIAGVEGQFVVNSVMANGSVMLTAGMITREAMRILSERRALFSLADRSFVSATKLGEPSPRFINVRKPPSYTFRS